MALDVFDIKLGADAKMPPLTDDTFGVVAVQVLDAIQTVVDVLTDNDGGAGWKVSFDPGLNAYTERVGGKRNIVVSGKPLLDARPGDSLTNVAAVMTGFAVHEVGHTKLDFFTAVRHRWPGKVLPVTLANIIEDVVLEARTVNRYRGFADNGDGDIFRPTLEWIAERTCPKTPLAWSGSTGHRVNVTGQIVRYRDFVSFANDEATQKALNFVEGWAQGITADLGPSGCVTLIEEWLDYVKATLTEDEPVEPPKPPKGGSEGGQQTLPDEDDDDDTEGGDTEGEGDDESEDDGEGNGEAEDGDEDGDDDGGTTDGGEDGEPGASDGSDADHGNRVDAPKGTNDTDGAGGSGQSISEAADPLDDYIPEDLPRTWDDEAKPENDHQQNRLNTAEQDERVTTRIDAGAFGKMRVIFR